MSVLIEKKLPLESGDRLTRAEFHRRYLASKIKKAELVEGVVYVASPVSARHAEPHGQIVSWLGVYQARHPELRLHDNATVFLDADNEVQPDACLWREDPLLGPRLNDDGYIEGAPQLIVEVAVSSASYDLHDKLGAYRRSGVLEYIVWRVEDAAIDWLRLREGAYERAEADVAGIIESTTFPGLRLHVRSMLAGDMSGVLTVLDRPTAEL